MRATGAPDRPAVPVAAPRPSDDAGFTLVELLVAVIVGGIVLAMIGAFLVTALRADQQLRSLNDASSTGELALDAMRTSLQSAAAPFAVGAGADTDDLMLRAAVASAGSGPMAWDCIAYHFDADRGEIRALRLAGAPGAPAARVGTPDASSLTAWPIVATDIAPPSDGEVFALGDTGSHSAEVRFRIDGPLGASDFSATMVARSQPSGGVACAP